MIAEADIRQMTKEERLDAISRLWTSLDDFQTESDEPPAWHGVVLAERMKKIEAGEETFYTLDEAWTKLEEMKAADLP